MKSQNSINKTKKRRSRAAIILPKRFAPRRLGMTSTLIATGAACLLVGIGAFFALQSRAADPTGNTSFAALPIGAGGWVTGMSMSNDGQTRLVRTDTYGGYYWDTQKDKWIQYLTAESMPAADIEAASGKGVIAIAVAPTDASIAYMAQGGSVFRSSNGARTWEKVLADKPGDANDDFRYWGERLVVDPNNANIVYYGTQLSGLWYSRDGGTNWSAIATSVLPAGKTVNPWDSATRGCVTSATQVTSTGAISSAGINSIVFDTSKGLTSGRTSVVYAASYGNGVWRSTDGGSSWSKISSDTNLDTPRRMTVAANGDLFVTSQATITDCNNSFIWRYRNGVWTNLTPNNKQWTAIAVDKKTPGRVIAIAQSGRTALSTNYGDTWLVMGEQWFPVGKTTDSSGDIPWLAGTIGINGWMSIGSAEFDPVVPNRLWITEGVGVWYHDVRSPSAYTASQPLDWHSQSRGIEQLVSNDVLHAPGGKPVVAAWDRPLFRSESVDAFPLKHGPTSQFGSAWSLDWSLTDPNFLVSSVASHQWPGDPTLSGYSTDGGNTWKQFGSIPLASKNSYETWGYGAIAVSTPDNMVWVPAYGRRPYYTKDRGATWQQVTLPGVTDYGIFNEKPYYIRRKSITADKVTPGTFYLYGRGIGIFKTTDGGANWTKVNSTNVANADTAWNVVMKAVPGKAGHLFFTPGHLTGVTTQPFMRSTNGGTTWSAVPNITSVYTYGYGKAAEGSTYPTIFIAGALNGKFGVYQSTDNTVSWQLVAERPMGSLDTINAMDGDKDVFGRVYIGYSGSGWSYGPVSSTTTPPPTTPPPPSAGTVVLNNSSVGTGLGQFQYAGTWTAGADAAAYNGDQHYTNEPNATYTLQFTGTRAKLVTTVDPRHGIAAVSIDGGPETMVDMYAATRAHQQLVYTSPVLAYTTHTLRFRVTGTKNASAADTYVVSDKIEVTTDDTQVVKSGDTNGDNVINGLDLSKILTNYGKQLAGTASGDVNSDGKVNALDLSHVLTNYGK